ncbi:hypothetical protein TWF694_011608 [Orbilia ellipsospora]|uniref:N-acetyltransferase domain-containing protein n=1 Tax=Orbilia ellipsospora TaxID=2528407 RepID=A0AAV9X609_9PEZI
MEVIYRKPEAKDLKQIAEIYNFAVRETAATFDTEEKPPEYFTPFLEEDSLYRMTVATVNGEVVAYAGTYPFSQRKAYSQLAEMMVYVHPEWQRKGVGRKLLREIHENGLLGGLHTILVLINKDNTYLHKVFEQEDYIRKGEMDEVALKFGKRHSLVIYQKNVK